MDRRRTVSPRNRRVTLMLVAVIGLFIVCVTPDAIMSTVFGLGYYDEDYLVRSIREVTDFLLTVNSAWNFLVYCAFNTVFRNRFRALIMGDCRRRWRRRQTLQRRYLGTCRLAAAEMGGPATPGVLRNRFSREPAPCSLVVTGANGQDVDVNRANCLRITA